MRFLRLTAEAVAWAFVAPIALAYHLTARLSRSDRFFFGWSEAFSLLPGHGGIYLRRAFYRLVLTHCGSGTVISFGTILSQPTARIGTKAYIGLFCALGDVTLEDDVLVASHVSIMNGSQQHGIERLDIPVREQPGQWPRVTIGRDTWIGERAIVMADVGRHCVVGAGAVVTKAVPNYAIVIGCPAKIIGYRGQQQRELSASIEDCARPLTASSIP